MPRPLGLALYAEGAGDYSFLPPILQRLAYDLCLRAAYEIQVGDVLPLDHPESFAHQDRATRILEAARQAWGAFHVLFVHTDGAGDPDTARAQRVQPGADAIAAQLGSDTARTVGVVPVRESEAWALVDEAALQETFGTKLPPARLRVPRRPEQVESILDPKKQLDEAYGEVLGPRRRRQHKVAQPLRAIGERVRLDLLRRVPAFQVLESDLAAALRDLGYLAQEPT